MYLNNYEGRPDSLFKFIAMIKNRILIYAQSPVKSIFEPLNHGVSRTSSVTRSFERLIFPHLHNKFSGKKSAVHTNS